MPKITTFLAFQERAEEAAAFYVSVFPNSRIVDTTRYGEGGPGPPGGVMTVSFELDGQEFVALNGGPHFTFTDGVSLSIECGSQDEVDHYSSKLTEGGGDLGPCGWLKDRFGLSWQVTPSVLPALLGDPDPERARRVMEAMLRMTKIDIAELERAGSGTA